MRAVRVSLLVVSLIVLMLLPAPVARVGAQEAPPQAAAPAPVVVPPEITEVVQKQFGSCFQVATERSSIKVHYLHPPPEDPWVPYFIADLDNDGVNDLIVIVRCSNPLANQADFDYTVVDPYYAANGYGNPKITAQFSSGDPSRNNLVLVLLGAGAEGWKAEKPRGKWVLINLPFDRLVPGHIEIKKGHKMAALSLQEKDEGGSSVVYYDGKRWRWRDQTGH